MKRRLWFSVATCGLLLGSPFASEAWIEHSAGPFCHSGLENCPQVPVALVLGAAPKLADGRENVYFQPRIASAAALYHAGKVRAILVSGDNGSVEYDEPTEMKNRLVALGVPAERVVCDYAGFRTLDSVVRAGKVFGQKRLLIVSQRFHNLRALYLARAAGLEASALNAADPPRHLTQKTRLREKFACTKALLDMHVLGTQPKFLGETVPVLE